MTDSMDDRPLTLAEAAEPRVREQLIRPRPPSPIRALNAALKAAVKAGLRVTGYKINIHSGEIEVVTDKPEVQDSSALDTWMAKHARATQGHQLDHQKTR